MKAVLDKERFGPWALVTGASSGIGKEFARQIAASGINIALVALREDSLKEAGVEFSKRYGVEHRVVVLDVSREDFIGQLASATGLSGLLKNRSRIVPGRLNRILNALVPAALARKMEADLFGKGLARKPAPENARAEA